MRPCVGGFVDHNLDIYCGSLIGLVTADVFPASLQFQAVLWRNDREVGSNTAANRKIPETLNPGSRLHHVGTSNSDP